MLQSCYRTTAQQHLERRPRAILLLGSSSGEYLHLRREKHVHSASVIVLAVKHPFLLPKEL